VKSAALAASRAGSADAVLGAGARVWRQFPNRVATFCLVELQKIRHDRTELFTRAAQPVLWLLIFGETFNRIRAIPTGSTPYLDFLAPGIIAQSGMFVAIFYGIQIIWERDAGVLTKLLVTPTPRSALVLGKSFAAGIRSLAQVVVVLVLSAVLGVSLSSNSANLIGAFAVVMLGSAFFSCLSMTVAGIVLKRERLMGIGQMITMPLFFASSALYPVSIMPSWLHRARAGESVELRSRRSARAAHRHARKPRARLPRAAHRRHRRRDDRRLAHRATRSLILRRHATAKSAANASATPPAIASAAICPLFLGATAGLNARCSGGRVSTATFELVGAMFWPEARTVTVQWANIAKNT
jgi:ABC-2 type transport system permease protein